MGAQNDLSEDDQDQCKKMQCHCYVLEGFTILQHFFSTTESLNVQYGKFRLVAGNYISSILFCF